MTFTERIENFFLKPGRPHTRSGRDARAAFAGGNRKFVRTAIPRKILLETAELSMETRYIRIVQFVIKPKTYVTFNQSIRFRNLDPVLFGDYHLLWKRTGQ